MSTIVTRSGKGSPLTHAEMDSNLTNLNTDKYQSGDPITVSSISDTGNLAFTGTGNRITGDFSNATVANRVMFQGNSAGNQTSVGTIAGAGGSTSGFIAWNADNATNGQYVTMICNGAEASFRTAYAGTPPSGTYLPMTFYTGGAERMRISASGNVGIGGDASVDSQLMLRHATEGKLNVLCTGANSTQALVASTNDAVYFGMTYGTSAKPIIFSSGGTVSGSERMRIDTSGNVLAGADNTQTMGGASNRWSVVYAGTGTINTSDAREKTAVSALTASELNASKQLAKEIGTYKFMLSIEEKGNSARTHIGMTVQRAIEIMEENNLNPFAYGFICHDIWEEKTTTDEDGNTVVTQTSGDRYAFRPDELLMFIARGFEARLASLESL